MMVIAHTSVGTAKYQFLAWTRVPNAGISLVSPQYEAREELYNPRSRAAPPHSLHTNLAMLALLILAIASAALAHEGHNGSDLLKIFSVKCEIFLSSIKNSSSI